MTLVPAAAVKSIKNAMARVSNISRPDILARFRPFFCAVLSGLLLALSFPSFSAGYLAWTALVPLFYSFKKAARFRAFMGYALSASLIFYLVSLHWLTHVTFGGWMFVVGLETSFFLLFGLFCFLGRNICGPLVKAYWVASAWSLMEWARAEIPVFGFGWNLLAYSQSDYPWVRMTANTLGAYGLGFVMVFVNALMAEGLSGLRQVSRSEARPLLRAGILPAVYIRPAIQAAIGVPAILFLLLAHGIFYTDRPLKSPRPLKAAVLQGNIPQDIKWEPEAKGKIIEIYTKLMQLTAYDKPELMVWPEASYPGYFNVDTEAELLQKEIAAVGIPSLIGGPHLETFQIGYNSAYLVGAEGQILNRYDKQRLVPFGEYVPLKLIFGWLEKYAYSMGVSDFTAGSKPVIFNLNEGRYVFGALICFEDIFPSIGRKMTEQGAQFLAAITNDAWYGRSAAAAQHLQAAVFRAVENGVPIIRASNTGISAFIDAKGNVYGRVRGENGDELFVLGSRVETVTLSEGITPYRLAGYLFPYAIAIIFFILAVSEWVTCKSREKKHANPETYEADSHEA